MEQRGAGRGGEENKQPLPQPQPPRPRLVQRMAALMRASLRPPPPPPPPQRQPQPPPPPPPPQLVQILTDLMRSSPSTGVPSTSATAAGDHGLNQPLIGSGSGENHPGQHLQSLDKYVHDYMIKKGMHKTAEIFRQEAGVSNDPIEIDEPDGFLKEWWSVFYDVYTSRQTKNQD